MDIQHLVDRLEQVLNESYRLPLSAYLLVSEDRVFGLVDQMRASIPEEIKRAQRIEAEKNRILAQAKEEAERIRELAKQEASELVRRDAILSSAEQRADNILERARRESEDLRRGADAYVIDVLTKLENELLNSLSVVRNGLDQLQIANQPIDEPVESQTDSASQQLPAERVSKAS